MYQLNIVYPLQFLNIMCQLYLTLFLLPLLWETAAHSWQPGPHCMASPSWPELTVPGETSEPS